MFVVNLNFYFFIERSGIIFKNTDFPGGVALILRLENEKCRLFVSLFGKSSGNWVKRRRMFRVRTGNSYYRAKLCSMPRELRLIPTRIRSFGKEAFQGRSEETEG